MTRRGFRLSAPVRTIRLRGFRLITLTQCIAYEREEDEPEEDHVELLEAEKTEAQASEPSISLRRLSVYPGVAPGPAEPRV